MSKKQDLYYFNNFSKCAECSAKASKLLGEFLQNFNAENLETKMAEMHEIEHLADDKKHELTETLVKAFITPIDREDIIEVSRNLDELTDKVEDVLIRLYLNHVKEINPNAIKMTEIVIQSCDEVLAMMNKFAEFKRSKVLKEHIIKINSLEEQGDSIFISSMHSLHNESKDVLYIIAWRDIYTVLEKCIDTAEHIADIVESIVMKNS